MVEPGYYIFLFSDVCGYTTIRIYKNDKYLIYDLRKTFEIANLDFQTYFNKTKEDTITLVSNMCENYGISVRDYTGEILKSTDFYTFEMLADELNIEVLEVVSDEI